MFEMSAVAAVALYCGLNIVILFGLSIAIGRIRMRNEIMVGDGGNSLLQKAMRGHANAIEIMPMTLLAMLLAALLGAWPWLIHLIGIALTIGRGLHAWHFTHLEAGLWQRMAGFGLSMLAMVGAAGLALVFGVLAL